MSEPQEESASVVQAGEKTDAAVSEERKPYEPPRLVKKRSVARATLFTIMGPSMTGITTSG